MKKFLIYILFVFSCISSYAQVQAVASIDSFAIYMGQQAHVTIDVTARKGDKIAFPLLKENHYLVSGVELLKVSKADTISLENNLIKVSKQLTITSFDEFNYPIPSFTIKVNGKDYQTNALSLKVIAVDVDTLHLDKMYPPKGVQDNPFAWSDWQPLILFSLLLIISCIALLYCAVKLKKNKPIFAKKKVIKHIPAHKKALSTIEEVKHKKWANSDDQKLYYTKLTNILRCYIEERFGFNALEMTSSEIIEQLKVVSDKQMIQELKELFETADLVKFAKYSVAMNENDFNLVNAIEFINQTKGEDTEKIEVITIEPTDIEKRTQHQRIIEKVVVCFLAISTICSFGYIVYNLWNLLY